MYRTCFFNRISDQLLFVFVTDVNTTSDEATTETLRKFCSCTSLIDARHMSPAYLLGDKSSLPGVSVEILSFLVPVCKTIPFLVKYSGYRSLLSRPVNSPIFMRPWLRDTFVCGVVVPGCICVCLFGVKLFDFE